jgi:hypothetical protein
MRSYMIGATTAALLAVSLGCAPAFALGNDLQFAGTVGASWWDYLLPGKTSHPNVWLANGSAVLTIDNPGLNIQANINNNLAEIPSHARDLLSYGGDIYWRDYAGSFGVNANFSTASNAGALNVNAGPYNVQSYGLFGQWFATPDLTLELKGGRFEHEYEGTYGDGGLVLYPYHDMALSVTVDYAGAHNVHEEVRDAVLTLEYLPVHDIPVSLYVGYDFSLESQLPHQQVSVLLVGIKAYIGGGGRNDSLVEYQRNGATNWDAASPVLFELGF